MIEVEGKKGVVARIIADSISPAGKRITTFEVEYPRLCHAEVMTHCMLARNGASSRAIPFTKMLQQLGAQPVRFGEANKGMQDKGADFNAPVMLEQFVAVGQDKSGRNLYALEMHGYSPEEAWSLAQEDAVEYAQAFYDAGYAKQTYNRLLEPFQFMKLVITATELNNFWWLRIDGAADPSIFELARIMKEAFDKSRPVLLQPGEWHLPYIHILVSADGSGAYYYLNENDVGTMGHVPLEVAIKVSAARTAAVSFRNEDYGVEKSSEVYSRLIGDERIHGSACEHQATPMQDEKVCGHISYSVNIPSYPETWEPGITHVDRNGKLWSAKFEGWIMHRKLIPGENKPG